jgi:TrpR family trp operon transcriptional repressor
MLNTINSGLIMESYDELLKVIADIQEADELKKFFNELLTPKERDDLSLRWQLLKELYEGIPQRTIAASHHISLCKITRGSKILKAENSVTKKILKTMNR